MKNKTTCTEFFSLFIITMLLGWAVGFRPVSVGSDTTSYVDVYNQLYQTLSGLAHYEYCYQLMSLFFANFSQSPQYLFSAVAFFDFYLVFFLAKRLISLIDNQVIPSPFYYLLGSTLLLSPIFFAIMVNVMRQGTGILAVFIFYILLASRANPLLLILFFFIAEGFHHTSLISLVFSPLVFLSYQRIRYLVIIAASLYLAGLSRAILFHLSIWTPINLYSRFYEYSLRTNSHSGVRIDFAIFTLSLGIFFHYLGRYLLSTDDRCQFYKLIKIYWILVLPFFFFGFTPFSDRYLLAGWLFMSVISATFMGLFLKKYAISIYWFLGAFTLSAIYFFLRAQGFLVHIL